MTEHEHEDRDEPVLMTSPGRMTRGLIIVIVTLAIGAAVTVTQFENFFSQAPPVTQLPRDGPETPPPPTEAGITRIAILQGSATQGNPDYEPDDAQVPLGNRVVWNNQDATLHTATSGVPSDSATAGEVFDTDLINGGESSDEIEIDGEVGDTIPYFCILHPWMTSQLTLVEAEEDGAGAGGPASEGPTLEILSGSQQQGNPAYDPDPLSVAAGDVINVVNEDSVIHTATSGVPSDSASAGQLFDTGLINAGESGTLDTAGLDPGEYDYFCIVHPYMVGKLQVTE